MSLTWILFFIACTAVLLMIPFVPLLWAVMFPADLTYAPALVPPAQDDDARTFRSKIETYCVAALANAKLSPGFARTCASDDELMIVVGPRLGCTDFVARGSAASEWLLVAGSDLSVGAQHSLAREAYSNGTIRMGPMSRAHALLADGSIELGFGVSIARWAEASGRLVAADHVNLGRSAKGGTLVAAAPGVVFRRVSAPVILFGHAVHPRAVSDGREQARIPFDPAAQPGMPARATGAAGSTQFEGDLHIPSNALVSGDIVVTGTLIVGSGARIEGNIEAARGIELRESSEVTGAVVSPCPIHIGVRAKAFGPVTSQTILVVESGSVLGTADAPTTVRARHIDIVSGAVIFGEIWAEEHGRVLAESAALIEAAA